jgi:hypothetical protein
MMSAAAVRMVPDELGTGDSSKSGSLDDVDAIEKPRMYVFNTKPHCPFFMRPCLADESTDNCAMACRGSRESRTAPATTAVTSSQDVKAVKQ